MGCSKSGLAGRRTATERDLAVRRLIRAAEGMLGELSHAERASVDELLAVLRRARANIDTALPIHMHGRARQPQPVLHPLTATGSDR
jgi:hypothetical protein